MVGKIADAIIEGRTESESSYDESAYETAAEYAATPETVEDGAAVV
jgi:hypothetical protein